jgi:hypothetical protein
MKTIETISIWENGELKQATVLNAYASTVNLGKSATFYYSLHSVEGGEINGMLAQGNLFMTDDDYQAWSEDQYAWDWVAAKLKLVITGDYVKPVPVQPEIEVPEVTEPEVTVPVDPEVTDPEIADQTEETENEETV